MRNYSHTIPQEVNQWDKFGIFTLPQMIVLGVGAVFCLGILSAVHITLGIFLCMPILALTAVVMLKKINKIPIYEFALVYLVYISTPKRYIYRAQNLKDDYLLEDQWAWLDEEEDIEEEKELFIE